ncbi:MAG TPA: hypothetical protein VKW04_25125 [Planctomycetota bacterium]|nr:hypothetical protein [Planctomycetota bacterium]
MHAVLALVLLLQESPETAFGKVESSIEKAKSVRVLYTITPSSEPDNPSRGTMSFQGDSTMKLSADLRSPDGTRIALWTEFDKGKIRSSVAGHLVELSGEGRQVRQNFNVYLSRLGVCAGAMFEHGFWTGASKGGTGISIDLKQMFSVTNFAAIGEGKNGSRILSYGFSSAFKPMPFVWAKIWYDPATYRLLRREELWSYQGKEEVLVEEYEIQLDGDKGAAPGVKAPTAPAAPRTEAEQDVLFIQAKLQVAQEHLRNGKKAKAIDVLEDLVLSFPKHPLLPEIRRQLEEAKK